MMPNHIPARRDYNTKNWNLYFSRQLALVDLANTLFTLFLQFLYKLWTIYPPNPNFL